jgi:hypothetical protein
MLRWLKNILISRTTAIPPARDALTRLRELYRLRDLHMEFINDKRRRDPDPPNDPYDRDTGVRVPRPHGPSGLSAAVAVAEPDDDDTVMAIAGPVRAMRAH